MSQGRSAGDAKRSIWRRSDGAWPSALAIGYAFGGHAAGLGLLVQGSWPALVAGVALTAHGLVVAAMLVHECAHQAVFRRPAWNRRLGEAVSWLCGASYASFGRIQHMHLRHHGDRADLRCFDLVRFLETCPGWLRRAILALEWAHLPACELVMHAQVIVRPFTDPSLRGERARVVATGASRLAFFAGLAWAQPIALAGYALAYLILVKALFLADAFAHTYPDFVVADPDAPVPRGARDADWDVGHTWSNLLSPRRPWLNLWNLNFGYHNAHHDRPAEPWYRLPEVHASRYPTGTPQVLPFRELWRPIHRNRVRALTESDPGDVGTGPCRADEFLGVHGVSFLTVV